MLSRKCKNTGNRAQNISLDLIPSQIILKETKKCHFTVLSEDQTVMKIYVLNSTTSKYITLEMLEIKGGIYGNVFTLGIKQSSNCSR